jgi:hypothetical protein
MVVVIGLSLMALVWASSGASGHHTEVRTGAAGPVVWAQPLDAVGHRTATALVARPPIQVWSHGSWCWFADPRAVHVVGQYDETFVGWIDWSGHVIIGAYDPSFGVIGTHVVGSLFHDDHGSPAIFVEPDKRLTVFFSGHNGATMNYRTTLRPEDISAWGGLRHVRSRLPGGKGFTYPNPILLPAEGNTLYLFWRGADWSQDYATRTIDGRWSRARRLIAAPGQRPYVKVDSNGATTIALAYTNGHPRERITSIYYAAYRHGALWTAGGRRIAALSSAPISPAQGDLVYNGAAAGVSGWVWDVALGADQRPVIVYATFPSPRRHVYWYARWTGARWVSHLMAVAGPTISPGTLEADYSGGMTLDHSDPSVVYLSRQVRGFFRIERWSTQNGGATWQHFPLVSGRTDNVRPVVPRDWSGGSMGLLWLRGDYRSYTTYRTSVAFLR